jgi:hypothetical protein
MRLAQLLHAAERAPRLAARLVDGQAPIDETLFQERQVQIDLVVEHLVVATPAEQRAAPREHHADAAGDVHPYPSEASRSTRAMMAVICCQPRSSRAS